MQNLIVILMSGHDLPNGYRKQYYTIDITDIYYVPKFLTKKLNNPSYILVKRVWRFIASVIDSYSIQHTMQ